MYGIVHLFINSFNLTFFVYGCRSDSLYIKSKIYTPPWCQCSSCLLHDLKAELNLWGDLMLIDNIGKLCILNTPLFPEETFDFIQCSCHDWLIKFWQIIRLNVLKLLVTSKGPDHLFSKRLWMLYSRNVWWWILTVKDSPVPSRPVNHNWWLLSCLASRHL